ncbi:MAG: tRNA lysidine(34) synthetase TilS [Myxococcota bacterium]
MRPLITTRNARRLLPSGSRVLVATSGGADSQALLHSLAQMQRGLEIELFAFGVDHGLRDEASAELELVAALCEQLGVPFDSVRIEVPNDGNLMEQARRARRNALRAHAKSLHIDRIALGHTATDVAETVLMNLARGSALRGAGVMPARRGRVVRPLLDATRAEARRYCDANRIPFADDPTNDDIAYRRPYVRHAVLPALCALSGDVERALVRFAREARTSERSLQRQAAGFIACHQVQCGPWADAPRALPIARLRTLDSAILGRVIRQLLEDAEIPVTQRRVRRVIGGLEHPGFVAHFKNAVVGVDRGHLFVTHDSNYRVEALHGTRVPPWGARLTRKTLPRNEVQSFPDGVRGVAFAAEALHFPLLVRPWAEGDSIRCFGHGGRAKVGDLFTNAKVPRPLREAWPVMVHGEEIVWVMGLRRSDFAPVTSDTTAAVVVEMDAAPLGVAY